MSKYYRIFNDKDMQQFLGVETTYALMALGCLIGFTVLWACSDLSVLVYLLGVCVFVGLMVYGRSRYKKNIRWLDELRVKLVRNQHIPKTGNRRYIEV